MTDISINQRNIDSKNKKTVLFSGHHLSMDERNDGAWEDLLVALFCNGFMQRLLVTYQRRSKKARIGSESYESDESSERHAP